jgi:hypothetical protein
MQGLSGRLDEVGRRNLDRDIVSTTVGHDLANRYLPVSPEPRPTVDIKIAFLENQQLMAGQQVPVVTNEMHGFHLEAHVPVLMQLVEALNTGTADPQQSIEPLQALYQHISETAQAASGDVNLEPMVKDTNRVLQLAEEQINNTFKSLQKIERDQEEDTPGRKRNRSVRCRSGPRRSGGPRAVNRPRKAQKPQESVTCPRKRSRP